MKLTKGFQAVVPLGGEEVTLSYREPTNEELNKFLSRRYIAGKGGGVRDTSLKARVEFHDKLLTGVDNLEDEDGAPVTVERADKIPVNWKNEIIFKQFEQTGIDIKNS